MLFLHLWMMYSWIWNTLTGGKSTSGSKSNFDISGLIRMQVIDIILHEFKTICHQANKSSQHTASPVELHENCKNKQIFSRWIPSDSRVDKVHFVSHMAFSLSLNFYKVSGITQSQSFQTTNHDIKWGLTVHTKPGTYILWHLLRHRTIHLFLSYDAEKRLYSKRLHRAWWT